MNEYEEKDRHKVFNTLGRSYFLRSDKNVLRGHSESGDYERYQNAIITTEGKSKSLEVLRIEITTYALRNFSECLASAVSDYITNGAESAILSRMIWQRIKEELSKMLLVHDTKLWVRREAA